MNNTEVIANRDIVKKTAEFVKNKLEGEGSGHDWVHIENVWKNALEIVKEEPSVDVFVVELGALLHDIADWKDNDGSLEAGMVVARKWLDECGLDSETIEKVAIIVGGVSFTGANNDEKKLSLEGYVVRDADRLEAMGERAVERTKKFGEKYGIPTINEYLPQLELTEDQYKNFRRVENSFVNHFFEKLLLLKNGLYTKKAKEVGQKKHDYMKNYLREKLRQLPEDSLGKKNVSAYLTLLDSEKYV